MVPIQLFSVFHLNLLYSSIEEERRGEVISRCYWPLLRIAKELKVPIGVEATGLTLEIIAAQDVRWIQELRELMERGLCEFIGSGYSQIIGPLVPARVNHENFRLGHEVYERVLGLRPRIALVNEQAYSSSLISHYLQAGYRGIIMEWENPARIHVEWESATRYLPQVAFNHSGDEIPIIWNSSMAFQQFQRFAHGDVEWEEYSQNLLRHQGMTTRAFCLYGNDAEVFDFRPSRYETESHIAKDGEWKRIQEIFQRLSTDRRVQFILPSEVLTLLPEGGAAKRIQLESLENPVPVKKQGKYNLLRWAVSGRHDAEINGACWKIYTSLKNQTQTQDDQWKELCFLWSSDYRTHITQKRWDQYWTRLTQFQQRLAREPSPGCVVPPQDSLTPGWFQKNYRISRQGHLLVIENDVLKIRLNCRRGMAIDGLWGKDSGHTPIFGTLYHGFFDDINWGADFYSGHLVFDSPGKPKVTDLNPVHPETVWSGMDNGVGIQGSISTKLGIIEKTIWVNLEGQVSVKYQLNWKCLPPGALRLGTVTLHPSVFNRQSLGVETHNGGSDMEKFPIGATPIDHGRPVSFLISGNSGFGFTEELIHIGDKHLKVSVQGDQSQGYVIPLVTFAQVGRSYFCRLSFSGMEYDDTTSGPIQLTQPKIFKFTMGVKKASVSQKPEIPSFVEVGAG